MSWILRTLAKHKKRSPSDQMAGVVHLEKHGLSDERTSDGSTAANAADSTSAFHEIDLGLEDWMTSLHGGSRTHEESEEEAMLRRRRREAVIVEEDGQPAGSADIIQRLPVALSGAPVHSAQDLQHIRDEVNLVDFQRIARSTE